MTASCPFRCDLNQKENAGSSLFDASRRGVKGGLGRFVVLMLSLVRTLLNRHARHDDSFFSASGKLMLNRDTNWRWMIIGRLGVES